MQKNASPRQHDLIHSHRRIFTFLKDGKQQNLTDSPQEFINPPGQRKSLWQMPHAQCLESFIRS